MKIKTQLFLFTIILVSFFLPKLTSAQEFESTSVYAKELPNLEQSVPLEDGSSDGESPVIVEQFPINNNQDTSDDNELPENNNQLHDDQNDFGLIEQLPNNEENPEVHTDTDEEVDETNSNQQNINDRNIQSPKLNDVGSDNQNQNPINPSSLNEYNSTSRSKSISIKSSTNTNSIESQLGIADKDVGEINKKLNKIGFNGNLTKTLIEEFQKYYGIKVTGIVDTKTLELIEQIYNSPLQNGKRHKDTIQLKKDLAFLGMPVPGNGTNLYGSQTEKKVKEFQKKNDLLINGIADIITLNKIKELIAAPLSNGMRREDVKSLKSDLEKLGFKVPGSGTNLYGTQTEKKVKEFQDYYGLKVTGIAEDETFNVINSILTSPLQKGKRHRDTVKLKKDLAFLGMTVPGNGTDLYGSQTEKKVKEFQKKNNLVVNGIADFVTLDKIKELISAPLSNGMRREDVKTLKRNLEKIGFKVPGSGTNLYGTQTEKKVKDFQNYFGLKVTGIVDNETTKKINSILSSPLQSGKRHEDTKKLKNNLKKLGFEVPGSGTNLYGTQTANKVRSFQAYYGLIVNGIADEVTLKKINEILASPLQNGKRHSNTISLKENLKRLGFAVPGNGTNFYGKQTENQVRSLQAYYGLITNGIADEITLIKINQILASPFQNGKRHKDTVKLKNDLAILGFSVPGNGTNLYGTQTERKVRDFQKANNLAVNGIADEVTLRKITELVNKSAKTLKIFIDPGHGGHDPGASGHGLREKDIVLDIAKRMEKYLNQYRNVEIMLSRTSDKYLSLDERTKMANDWGADYFVSVHTNAFNGSAHGFESFIHNGNRGTADAKAKQNIIHDHIAKNISEYNRGKKSANFRVLRNTNMSAILFEYLFIDNKQEANQLGKSSYRDRLARLTAEGIANAFNLTKK